MPQMKVRHVSIGQLLLAQGVISREQLDKALAAQRAAPTRKLASILVDLGYITQMQANASLEVQDVLHTDPLSEAVRILEDAIGDEPLLQGAQARHTDAQELHDAVIKALAALRQAGS